MSENQKLLALLIDGDNADPAHIPKILAEISKRGFGDPKIRNVYGDFSQQGLQTKWDQAVQEYGLKREDYLHSSTGKNGTDIVLTIDAMDMLYSDNRKLSGFCIYSNDRDFTHLAHRIRRQGLSIYGLGSEQSQELLAAYDDYIAVERLDDSIPVAKELSDEEFFNLCIAGYERAYEEAAERFKEGWIPLSQVKAAMIAIHPALQSKSSRALVEKWKSVADAHPKDIEVNELTDRRYVVHEVRVFDTFDKLRHVYQIERLNISIKDDGWVWLTLLAQRLQSEYGSVTYKGTSSSKLQKMIDKMQKDYPEIELWTEDGQQPRIRIQSSV
ncbi:MAG: NYN domain-containing protein [Anaerolineae bacterium]|nr:NYN domain-containing protein [Anaerolineae bacterium]